MTLKTESQKKDQPQEEYAEHAGMTHLHNGNAYRGGQGGRLQEERPGPVGRRRGNNPFDSLFDELK